MRRPALSRAHAWVGLLSGRHARTLRQVLVLTADTLAVRGDGLEEIQDRITSKNGAQVVETWTPPETAEHLEGDTAMHTLPSNTTPRAEQIIAALALAHLLEADTPDAEWHVTPEGRLCGRVKRLADRDSRTAMRRFAAFLGARLGNDLGHNRSAEWTRLHVDATYQGAPVTVWAHVDFRAAVGEETAEQRATDRIVKVHDEEFRRFVAQERGRDQSRAMREARS